MGIAYRIGAVSKLTGISTDTLRAWERRYRAVVPKRHEERRGYDQADVERLILLRRVVEKGHAISSVASLPDADLRGLISEKRVTPTPALVEPLLAALEEYDYAAVNEQLGRIAAVLPTAEVVQQVVLPVMREVGERWHLEQMSVAQEHMISALVEQLLGTFLRLQRPAPGAPKVIYATPEGELHAIGILAAAMLAPAAGVSPIYLGPSLPSAEIAQAARRSGAKVVVLQVCGEAAGAVKSIRELLPGGVELWVGGGDSEYECAITLPDFAALEENYRRLAAS